MAADLKGRVALVTGVGPGLGQGIAVGLARAGASVVVCDVNDEAIAATRKDVEGEGAECLALRCDMSDSQAVREMFDAARARLAACTSWSTTPRSRPTARGTPNGATGCMPTTARRCRATR